MATKYTGDPGTRVALDTFIKLMRCSDSFVSRMLGRGPLGTRLTMSQFAALEALYHAGPMCPAEIAQKVLRTRANMTLVIDHLVREGLVTRTPDETDRRKVMISLTEAGHARISEVFPRVAEAIRAEFAVLSLQEQQQLGELCRKLGRGPTPGSASNQGG